MNSDMSGYSLTYIYHDCFVWETREAIFVFDYWKDPLAAGADKDNPPLLTELQRGKRVYVLVSHHHKDHFTRRIFRWGSVLDDVRYIISRDVYKSVSYLFREDGDYRGTKPDPNRVTVLEPGEVFENELARVSAFGSTDIGNSYAVECGTFRIFHAGDLNAWLWIDESTPREIEEARVAFTDIVAGIREKFPEFDLVMFPVDSRLGREYWWGAKYFVEHINVRMFVPMHFELVLDEKDKQQRRLDAAAFNLFGRNSYGSYLQLAATRACYIFRP